MAIFEAKEFSFSDIHNGERYQNGDIPDAEAINKPIEASYYAQEKAKNAYAKADQALNYVFGSMVGELPALAAYPVGSIYISVSETSPASLFGGTWEKIKDCFLLASGDYYTLGDVGGSANAVVVEHRHTFTTNYGTGGQSYSQPPATGEYQNGYFTNADTHDTGEDGTGKNMPPYLVVNVWKRIV